MTDVKPSPAGQPRRRGRPDQGARNKLIAAATELFIERDFDDVPTEEIIRRAGVSRGALYHHFPGKRELFQAVYEKGERALVEQFAAQIVTADGPYDALLMTSRLYLEECETSPYLRRIGLGQSQAVLGWTTWRHLALQSGLGLTVAMVAAAIEAGELAPRDPELVANLLLAALIDAALLVIAADDPAAVRDEAQATIAAMLSGLRARGGHS